MHQTIFRFVPRWKMVVDSYQDNRGIVKACADDEVSGYINGISIKDYLEENPVQIPELLRQALLYVVQHDNKNHSLKILRSIEMVYAALSIKKVHSELEYRRMKTLPPMIATISVSPLHIPEENVDRYKAPARTRDKLDLDALLRLTFTISHHEGMPRISAALATGIHLTEDCIALHPDKIPQSLSSALQSRINANGSEGLKISDLVEISNIDINKVCKNNGRISSYEKKPAGYHRFQYDPILTPSTNIIAQIEKISDAAR